MFPAERIYAFDAETDTSRGHGLNPLKARITDLSLSTEAGDEVFSDADEADLLTAFDDAIYDLPPGLLLTWNGTHFDLPFLDTRFDRNGLLHHGFSFIPTPAYPPKYELLPGHDSGLTATYACKTGVHAHLDIAYAAKAIADREHIKWALKPVARALGIDMIELDRTHLERYSEEERRAYVGSDSRGTRQVGMHLLGVATALSLGHQAAA